MCVVKCACMCACVRARACVRACVFAQGIEAAVEDGRRRGTVPAGFSLTADDLLPLLIHVVVQVGAACTPSPYATVAVHDRCTDAVSDRACTCHFR
jgi:hypothetical protein